jgi:hypothetical protein
MFWIGLSAFFLGFFSAGLEAFALLGTVILAVAIINKIIDRF